MDREYRPESVEAHWRESWERERLFEAAPESGRAPFCMVIPPPNVTGNLHIGHVLVYTLHDIVARWRRMQGRDVLWLPGTDHAGIATQTVVERELSKEGRSRHDLGREGFERRAWEWKETYGGRITTALRELGSSVDWSRERFTLDPGLSRAVRTVFVRLHEEGLIYRDRYIVNWCPRCHTAISDLETVYEEVEGRLYTVRYPGADDAPGVTVATTRPETMLGDTGVAVHPDDDRYRSLVGAEVEVPLTGRRVPVIADDFVDPAFGTGAVKITPGHDPNDFAAGRRHGLPELLVIDTNGAMTAEAGPYAGLDRYTARQRVVADLEAAGQLLEVKPHRHAVGHCQRCGTMIEPLISTQWFVRVAPLAAQAIDAVERGRTRFVPENWAKTYYEWMRNIHDWCISRQLWWGHRIPAWYCDDCGRTIVALDDPAGCPCGGSLRQDEDVLDTWFSSALWPFSTLGWPEQTPDLRRYYPTDLLITGHDIIFFWVARMMMMGLKFMGDVPFREVYIHGLVRDAHGQKMSKSKGNVIEPAVIQQRYGTDAVRFTMAILAAPGNDIPLAHERMEGYRAFANKLWNACRFVQLKAGEGRAAADGERRPGRAERWILSRANATIESVTRAMEEYRFDRAADLLYHFVWGEYCDWYIELSKVSLQSGDEGPEGRGPTARAVLVEVADLVIRLLHPFMPFLTAELWRGLPGHAGHVALAPWPTTEPGRADVEAERDVALLQEAVVKIRNLRAESNIDPARRIALLVQAERIDLVETIPSSTIAARGVVRGIQIAIPLEGLLDLDAERARLRKEIDKVAHELGGRDRKLADPSFLDRAPPEVVEKERRLRAELAERRERLSAHLAALGET